MKKILIVEDIDLNIDLISQLLEEDYSLLIAKDGAQGVKLTEEQSPDLVLMDISLPVMNGYEATMRIREKNTTLPIIGLSAHAMSGDRDKALEAGCNDYLTKPVDEDQLLRVVRQFLD
jgi:two-component system, cell cycle response regulator DivK